jgi:hypothetical protein
MHPERVVIARVSVVVTAVVAIIIVVSTVVIAATVGAFESLLLGHLFPNVQILSSLPAVTHELGLRSSE